MLPWQPFVMNVSRNRKMKKLAYFPRYWLILLKFGAGGYFWILNPKSTIKFIYHVILTSKWREGKMPIYCLQKMHITSLWRHLWSKFFENVNLSSSYDGLSPYQIWFNLEQGKQNYGGGRNPLLSQVENVLNCPGEIGLKHNRTTVIHHFGILPS